MFYKTIFLSILQQLFLQHAALLFYRVVPHPACRLVKYHMLDDIHYAKNGSMG